MKIKANSDTLLTCIFVGFWCKTPIASVLAALVGRGIANGIVNAVLFVMLATYLVCFQVRNSAKIFLVYFLIALTIILTILIHPEYSDWYNHSQYGIKEQFLDMRGGIWAFLLVSLYKDDERLLRDLKLATTLVFLAYFSKFIVATFRGYWLIGVGGKRARYDLEFGFRILFSTAFWGAYGLFRNKKYLYLYVAGLLIILMGGSRAAFVWGISIFAAALPFKYKDMSRRQKFGAILMLVFFLPVVAAVFTNFSKVVAIFAELLKKLGISSRTLASMASGTMAEDNGRDIIYKMAKRLISNGGLFGYGFYGDRVYIGRYFYWGYSHNIFLELFVTFGYLGGTVLSAALIIGIIKLYRRAVNDTRKIIFISLLTLSFRLLLSNSFWYEPSFWAMLALMLRWKDRPAGTGKKPTQLNCLAE